MGTVYILMGTTDVYAEEPHYDILAVYQTRELALKAMDEWTAADTDYDHFYINAWQVRDTVEDPRDFWAEG